MNLAGAREELAARGFDYLTAERLDVMLNRARNDFEDFWTWPWLQRSATGISPLTIADLKYVLLVKNDVTNDELLGLDIRQIEQDGTDLQLAGTPTNWWLTDDGLASTISVWPKGPATLRVRYIAESDELVAPTDAPLIPARYHPVWVDLAVVQGYKDSDNFPAAQALLADANARLYQLVERYETRNRQNGNYISQRTLNEDD